MQFKLNLSLIFFENLIMTTKTLSKVHAIPLGSQFSETYLCIFLTYLFGGVK